MTQQRIQRIVYCLCLTASLAVLVTTLYIREHTMKSLIYFLQEEMVLRSEYVGQMMAWLPSTAVITPAMYTSMQNDLPFEIKFVPENETSFRGLDVSSNFPFIVQRYLPSLKSVFIIHEENMGGAQPICGDQTLIVGVSFIFILTSTISILVQAGNLLAHWRPSLRPVGIAVAVLGLLSSLCIGVTSVTSAASVADDCRVSMWMDDYSRSISLYGGLYSLLSEHFISAFPLKLLFDTMNEVKNGFAAQSPSSVHIVDPVGHTIFPPIQDKAVSDFTLSAQAGGMGSTYEVPGTDALISSYNLNHLQRLLVLYTKKEKRDNLSASDVRMALIMFCVPTVLVVLSSLILFPYNALGRLGDEQLWRSPWEWRQSLQWPLWTTMHCAMLVAFIIGVGSYFISSTDFYFVSINLFFDLFRGMMRGAKRIVTFNRALLRNQMLLMTGNAWDLSFMKLVDNSSKGDISSLEPFFQIMYLTLAKSAHAIQSVALELKRMPEAEAPLLTSHLQIVDFYAANQDETDDMLYLKGYVAMWDVEMLAAVFKSTTETLLTGSEAIEAKILDYAKKVDTVSGEATFREGVQVCLMRMEPLANIATELHSQTSTNLEVQKLLSSEDGVSFYNLIQDDMNEALTELNMRTNFSFPYKWSPYPVLVFLLLACVMSGLKLIMDILHTSSLFGCTAILRKQQPTHRVVPSGDYTAPAYTLNVNRAHVAQSARLVMALVALLTIICVGVILIMCERANSSAKYYMALVLAEQRQMAYFKQFIDTASIICLSAYEWLYTQLAMQKETLSDAIRDTFKWAVYGRVKWPDGPPGGVNNKIAGGLDGIRSALRTVANLVSAQTSEKNASIHGDFNVVLEEVLGDFTTDVLAGCATAKQFASLSESFRQYLLALLYNKESEVFEAIYKTAEEILAAATACPKTDQLRKMHVAEVLQRRAASHLSRQEMATLVWDDAIVGAQSSMDSATRILDELQIQSSDTVLYWIPTYMAWISVPILYCVYRFTSEMYNAIYFS